MIKRIYKTKRECVELMVNEDFNAVRPWDFLSEEEIYERFFFYGEPEDEDGTEPIDLVCCPMWSYWWVPNDSVVRRWIENHYQEVVDCGFTIVEDADGYFYAIGIDGCGYSFFDTHFLRLYNAQGLHWHDEDTEGEED